ncbi:SPFH domain-containing protein [Vibrio owensii]|uniref:SPFH domain-containing protein n=1 Tax=Vibrio owensii TaxID=696485 RepID=UPI0018F211B1|nr:SPFH domain-containing protein [Vibrio owensii]
MLNELLSSMSTVLNYIIILCVTVVILKSFILTVKQGEEVIIERFGKFLRTQAPGITFMVPFMDVAAHRVSTKERQIQINEIECITKDNASVTVSAVTFIRVFNSKTSVYNVENLDESIHSLSVSTLRSQIGEMDLDETLSNRDRINTKILEVVTPACELYGVKQSRCELTEITPSRKLIESMEQQVVAERDRRSVELTAQADRDADIKRAEGKKEAAILEAQGNLQTAKLEAEAIERKGEAEAKAVRSLNEALSDTSDKSANYFLGQAYIEAFSKLASSDNNKLVLMPTNASSTMGTISGIAEMLGHAKN